MSRLLTGKKGGTKANSLYNVLNNLNSEIRGIEKRTTKGFIRAAIVIHRAMETEEPKIPVDTANLRHSWFSITAHGVQDGSNPAFKGPNAGEMNKNHSATLAQLRAMVMGSQKPMMIMGFTASYAWFVHEMVDASFQRPGAGSKFLESALTRKKMEIVEVIRQEAHV